MSRDLGDFQTPPALVEGIIKRLQASGGHWERALEPTCGQGNFIAGLLKLDNPPSEIIGAELQADYVEKARNIPTTTDTKLIVLQQNIFELNLSTLHWTGRGPLLVIGNPPWVTNTELSTLNSYNLPTKTNLKNLSGLEAMTGSSNFDIAESIWIKLIRELASQQATIALLCKTSVARNVLHFAAATNLPIKNAMIIKIDAKKWFGASTDACLFCLETALNKPAYEAPVFEEIKSTVPTSVIGFIDGQLVTDIQRHADLNILDGNFPLTWRQGIKHDASSVVELKFDEQGKLYNKTGDLVEVEAKYLYPFFKSSDLAGKGKLKPKRAVIVPQKHIGEDTTPLKLIAPDLWKYLNKYRDVFDQRKSSIYSNQPPFSYFGLGDYSFAPFKVAISGMYKTPVFRVLTPLEDRAIMVDDTCYFLPCNSALQAVLIATLLNSAPCLSLLNSIIFWDAKRPVTKKLLQRIDICALLGKLDRKDLIEQVSTNLSTLEAILSKSYIESQFEKLHNLKGTGFEEIIKSDYRQPDMPSKQLAFPGF